jgi:hypothetical protein
MFDTYGPFALASHSWDDIDLLYKEIQGDEPGLQFAVGLYIVSARSDDGSSLPWYVGLTTREFGQRLLEHFKGGKFTDLASKGELEIFLIALRNGKEFVKRDEATEAQKLMIEQLEQQLIDHCIRLNENLLNKKLWSRNQIYVPGFIDKGASDRNFPAAQALATLLKT